MASVSAETNYGFLSEKDKTFPPMVVAEITNVCNLHCIHCPYTFISKHKDYVPKYMKWKLYQKIVEEVSDYRGTIFRLLCDGEPLLHPRFLDMVRLAKSKEISPVNFITNGLLLKDEIAAGVLEAGVEVVEISLDALTKETYERIRRGSDYELVVSNTNRFIELRDKMRARTKIMVSIIDQPEAERELDAFIKYWSAKVDKVIKRDYTTIGGLVGEDKIKINIGAKRWPCPQLWRRIFINVEGLAEFCVEDWHDQTVIADINTTSIKEAWHSSRYQDLRSCHLAHRFNEIPYCAKCIDWPARRWDYDYFSALEELKVTI